MTIDDNFVNVFLKGSPGETETTLARLTTGIFDFFYVDKQGGVFLKEQKNCKRGLLTDINGNTYTLIDSPTSSSFFHRTISDAILKKRKEIMEHYVKSVELAGML